MQTVSVDINAIVTKRIKQARLKRILGALFLLVAFGGLANFWAELPTLFAYPAVWPLGLAIIGFGFLLDAQYVFRTKKEPKGYLALLGQVVVLVGMAGPFFNKWLRLHNSIGLWPLLAPLVFVAAALLVVGIWSAVKTGRSWIRSFFSRER